MIEDRKLFPLKQRPYTSDISGDPAPHFPLTFFKGEL